jgi:hypothetical protein
VAIDAVLGRAADRGVKGALVQVLDPDEEAFPYDGRTVFESMSGTLAVRNAEGEVPAGGVSFAARGAKDRLLQAARRTGWQYQVHHTDQPGEPTLLWLYRALEKVRA